MDNVIGMVRPEWTWRNHFLEEWKKKNITAVICQRKTKDNTRLCVESFLRFYPDCPILLIDGDSQDDSTMYCQWMAAKHPNITLWEKPNINNGKHTSHGETLHAAITLHVNTKYVLLLDSDTITERGGWIEEMLSIIQKPNILQAIIFDNYPVYNKFYNMPIYAIGSLMLPGRKGEAIKPPEDENDILRYAHPSCSIIDRDKYLEISKTFTHWPDGQVIPNIASDHGSPLVWNMMGAADLGYSVEYFPVDKYVSHLSGASWCEPQTIWPDDHDVKIRPFVTFIFGDDYERKSFWNSTNLDFETMLTNYSEPTIKVVIHGKEPVLPKNYFYALRFVVKGEYICFVQRESQIIPQKDTVNLAIKKAIELNAPDEFEVDGLNFVKRSVWQKRECLSQ